MVALAIHTEQRSGRHLLGVVMPGGTIGMFIKVGVRTIEVTSQIPADAEFLTAHFNYERNAFVLVFEHPSFEFVPEGKLIPWIESEIRVEELERVE